MLRKLSLICAVAAAVLFPIPTFAGGGYGHGYGGRYGEYGRGYGYGEDGRGFYGGYSRGYQGASLGHG